MIGGVKMIKVSVIMPVYNCEDFLKDSVESILNQTLYDLELICVDDGSTDNSLEILKEYESQDSRVKVFALNHLGGGDARNFALKHISGEYLYFMDADDILDLNAFETFYPISKEKNLDFLMFKAKKYYVVQKILSEHDYYNMAPLSKFKDEVFNFRDLGDLIFNINVAPWCKFYNSRFVLDSGAKFRSQSKFHDNQFFWDIIFQAERIFFLDEFYYTQNVHPKSLIESAGKSHCDTIDVRNDIWELFKKHGQFDKFKQRLFRRKINLHLMRYNEIKDEFKELFFKKMKEDLTNMSGSDFRDYLLYAQKFVFDSVLISKNHNDFDILTEFYYILINGQNDVNQKMNQSVSWFNKLSKPHKRFSFNYIQEYFKNQELTPENREFLNKFQQDLISVIMPVYNCEDYLKGSVDSILNQTLSNLELICVDDGSTDNSLKILKEYEKQDSRVKVFSIDHVGGGYARNFAMNHISGEYLYFIDADDVLDLNAFEIFYPISKEKNLDFLMFKAKNYDVNDNVLFEKAFYNMAPISNKVKDNVFNFRDIGDLIFKINVTPWSKFYNSEFVISSGAHFKNGSKFNDNQFFWDIIFQAERIYFLDEFYYTHTVRSDSLIGSCDKNHCDSIDVNNDVLDLFKKHGQFENFRRRLYNRKILLFMQRYDEILDEYKELFFLKMKQDFKRNIDSDFRNNLDDPMRFVYDGVLISKNHEEFDRLNGFYPLLRLNNISFVNKMDLVKVLFDNLDKNQKMFTFAFIKKYLTEENEEFFKKFIFKVSVVIPVYNTEDYLDDAFNSILNQSIGFENLQVIFVDDASTDFSPQIIKKYSDKYDNVCSIFLDKNSGYAGLPRNVGMKYANADYLMFLDSDDVFTENACEVLYSQITFQNLDIVSGLLSEGENVPDWIWRNLLTDSQETLSERVKKCQEMLENPNFELEINTIDEYPSVISAANIMSKIFKKSLIDENNITFPVSMPAEDSVFLLNALLNANGIKFINETIFIYRKRLNSSENQFSKDKIIKRINAYFMMFYTCLEKNKTEIFKHYLLGDKLRYLLVDHIMKCNLPTSELLEIFIYSKPLFKLYVDYGGCISSNLYIFDDIANGDFESALRFIHGEHTTKLTDIKCVTSTDYHIKGCIDLSSDWQNQFEMLKPDLFVFDKRNRNEKILNYCLKYNIRSAQLDVSFDNLDDILDSINFKYIPDLKHLVLIYRLDDLRDLNNIKNHFHSIDYPFKHLKMITSEDNLFLSDTILESDLDKFDFDDNYYCCFADLDFEFDDDIFNECSE